MYYAIVGPGVMGVYDDWKRVNELAHLFPYCKYRKFKTEEECWQFVYRFKYTKNDLSLTKYGNTFSNLFVRMSYIVTPNMMYFTYNTEHFGHIRLDEIPGALVKHMAKCITVKMPSDIELNNSTILSHLQVINRGVEILGDLIDVDIVVPDHSIYYALTAYTGTNGEICSLRDKIKNRLAGVSFTLKAE